MTAHGLVSFASVASPAAPSKGLPPGPRAPALVNTLGFARHPLDSLLRWHRRYGDVFTVKLFVFGTGIYVADPHAIRELFSGDQSDLRAGEANALMSPVLGEHSVLVLDGREHLRQRRLLLPPFQGSRVAAFREIIREVAESELDRWRPGERLVLRERMRALTFEVICRAVFGVGDAARVEQLRTALLAIIETGALFLLPAALRADLGPLSPGGRLARQLRAADALIYREIEERRAAGELDGRPDVLSLLLSARDEEGHAMTDRELRDELVTMLLAGHETTATGLAFAVDLLLRNPRVLARLREELEDGRTEYLEATAKEALRLRPVIDAVQRNLLEPRTVAGWELPAGSKVYPGIALVHHRADLYPRPFEFRPERFTEEGAESYAWIPFGGGIRRCIGAALAQAEMAEVLSLIAQRSELQLERREPEPVVLHGITLVPKHGVPVRVLRTSARSASERPPALAPGA
jgi:cytochrome P450